MKSIKKVILFIVEGESDSTSLGAILSKLLSYNMIKFCIMHKDITSDKGTKPSNAINKIWNHIKLYLKKEPGITKSNICQIVHLIDMDGAYIKEDKIKVEKDIKQFKYTETYIKADSIEKVNERNVKKQKNINRLCYCKNIRGIPYTMYYFSCNLEHVLHNEINLEYGLKMEYAENFSDSYYDKEKNFIEFINDDKFAVKGDYNDTWEFIKCNGNSLKRYSNFHLFFKDR